MAKKAAKREAPAAKAKKITAKSAVAKKAAKAVKPAKTPEKAAPVKAVKEAKVEKPPAKTAAKPVKTEKIEPVEKAPAAKKVAEKKTTLPPEKPVAKKAVVEVSEAVSEAPKKGKKVKLEKSGMSEDQMKWQELHDKYKSLKAPAYSISGQYEAKTPVQHKIFGWGFILSNEYDRLEVLFEDAKRMLISNRKLS